MSSDSVVRCLEELAAAKASPLPPKKKRGRGAPPGNLNALKTGRYTAKTRALRREMWVFTSGIDSLLRMVERLHGFEIGHSRSRKQKWPAIPEELRRKYREKAPG